jgi:hypothetical protein
MPLAPFPMVMYVMASAVCSNNMSASTYTTHAGGTSDTSTYPVRIRNTAAIMKPIQLMILRTANKATLVMRQRKEAWYIRTCYGGDGES